MSTVDLPGPPLRIAVLGDFEGTHTQRWLRVFVQRGHDVHAISYYQPRAQLPGVSLHVLSGQAAPSAGGPHNYSALTAFMRQYAPHAALRLGYGLRYLRAGLKSVLAAIEPDVFHAHFVVEHGFYGALAGFHPFVVSAWGSDIFVESHRPASQRIAAWTLNRADFVTAADPAMAARAIELGARRGRVEVIRLGVDGVFLARPDRTVNLQAPDLQVYTVISDRALEPLYNVDLILHAFARLRQSLPSARLLIANEGSQRAYLGRLAEELGQADNVLFLGRLGQAELRQALEDAQVYVSFPETDSLALSTMEAMAVGCFPVVSDLPSQDGWIRQRRNGLRAAPGDVELLADALYEALLDPVLRHRAVGLNRELVEAEGMLATNMLEMERHYYRLAGRPVPAPTSASSRA